MRNVAIVIAMAATAASAAGAAVYVDEDFESRWLPEGWSTGKGGQGPGSYETGWIRQREGPPHNYHAMAYGYAQRAMGYAYLRTPNLNVPANTTVYYGYDYKFGWTSTLLRFLAVMQCFHVGHSTPFYEGGHQRRSSWEKVRYHFTVPESSPFYVQWYIYVNAGSNPGSLNFWLDNVTLTDEEYHAVAPASLGRVKALFR